MHIHAKKDIDIKYICTYIHRYTGPRFNAWTRLVNYHLVKMIRRFSYLYNWNPLAWRRLYFEMAPRPHATSIFTISSFENTWMYCIEARLNSHIKWPMSSSNFCLWRLEAKVSISTCCQYPIWMVSIETLHAVSRLFFWQHQSVLTADTSMGTMQVRNKCATGA